METFEFMELHFSNDTHTQQHRTFSMTLVTGMDVENVRLVAENYVSCGWELSAVHVHTDYDYNGPTVVDMNDVTDAVDFFEILETESNETTRILAFGEHCQWDADDFRKEAYQDFSCYMGHSDADIVEEYYYEVHEELMSKIGADIFLSIDWEHTAYQLSTGGVYFYERNGIHVLFV